MSDRGERCAQPATIPIPPTPQGHGDGGPAAGIRDNDVVCEKGRGDHERWPGNKLYRHLVSANKESYNDRTPMERSEIIGNIIATIKENKGWFVQQNTQTGKWADICEEKVRKKVSDDLRREVRRRREKRSSTTVFSARLKSLKGSGGETDSQDGTLKSVDDPRVDDVLFGPGARRHPGNKEYWDLMKRNLECYIISPYGARSMISRGIVEEIKERNGRFLEQDPQTSEWYEISDLRAIEKTSHALSNKKYKNRKKTPGTPPGEEPSFRSGFVDVLEIKPAVDRNDRQASSTVSIESKLSSEATISRNTSGEDTEGSPFISRKPTVRLASDQVKEDGEDDPSVAVRLLELRLLGQEVKTDPSKASSGATQTSIACTPLRLSAKPEHNLRSSSPLGPPASAPPVRYIEQRDDVDQSGYYGEYEDYTQVPSRVHFRGSPYDYESRDPAASAPDRRLMDLTSREEELIQMHRESMMRGGHGLERQYRTREERYHDPYYRASELMSPVMMTSGSPSSDSGRGRLLSADEGAHLSKNLFGGRAKPTPSAHPRAMRRNSWVHGGSYEDPIHDMMAYRRMGTERRMSAYAMLSKPASQWTGHAISPAANTPTRQWHTESSVATERRESASGSPGWSSYDV